MDQSTQHLTVLNPRFLIFFKSSSQALRFFSGLGSSIGARALPPPYQIAKGKNVCSPRLRACSLGKSAGAPDAAGRSATDRKTAKTPPKKEVRRADDVAMFLS